MYDVYIYKFTPLHSSLIGLVLTSISTKSGQPTGLSLCYSVNAIANVLCTHISGIDIPKSSGSVLNALYIIKNLYIMI